MLTALHRPLLVVLPLGALAALAVVGLAQWNPWRLTALDRFADPRGAIAAAGLAAVLLVTAGLIRFGRGWTSGIALGLSMVAIAALCVGGPLVALLGPPPALAVSPDGAYAVVKLTGSNGFELYLRSRALLLGRQAATPLGRCTDSTDLGDTVVHFTDNAHIAVTIADGYSTSVAFDPATLAPTQTVDLCPAPSA